MLHDTTPSRSHASVFTSGYRAEFRCNISSNVARPHITEHAALDALRIISLQTIKVHPAIELPIRTDVSWPGHRFSLDSISSGGPRHLLDQLISSSSRTSGLTFVEETPLPRPNSQRGNGTQGCGSGGTCSAFDSGGDKGDSPSEQRGSQCPDRYADGIGGAVANT